MRLLYPARSPGASLDQQIEYPGREVHRTREQSGEIEIGLMLGGIAALASPRIVFLTARPFPAHHVGISATLTSVVNRLVHVHHDVVLRRFLHHLTVVTHHELRVVRVPLPRRISHVSRL